MRRPPRRRAPRSRTPDAIEAELMLLRGSGLGPLGCHQALLMVLLLTSQATMRGLHCSQEICPCSARRLADVFNNQIPFVGS